MDILSLVKIGGHITDEPAALREFLSHFATLPGLKILVHGGGKAASRTCAALGITPVIVEGRRVTDTKTLDVLTGVYGGSLNKSLVTTLQTLGCNALGLTGADGRAVEARKRVDSERDWGYVGDITKVNTPFVASLLTAGLVPVFAPLTLGDGTLLNTNADTLAAALAVALRERYAVRLYFCFEHAGVLGDVQDASSCVSALSRADFQHLRDSGAVNAGMVPKLVNGFDALAAGVQSVGICHASAMARFAQGLQAEGTWLH